MHVIYEDREEAGRRLAKALSRFRGTDALLLAIPRGGVPVGATIAHRLELEWNVVVTRKLPIPWSPEAGFGAIAADGTVVLNEGMVHALQMRKSQIDGVVQAVQGDVRARAEFFSRERPSPDVSERTVIVVDDGLASGYTMLAAVRSLRARSAARIIAASPVASRSAAALIEEAADECVFEIVSPSVPFAVADFYVVWHDLTDEDILPLLRASKEPAHHHSAAP